MLFSRLIYAGLILFAFIPADHVSAQGGIQGIRNRQRGFIQNNGQVTDQDGNAFWAA